MPTPSSSPLSNDKIAQFFKENLTPAQLDLLRKKGALIPASLPSHTEVTHPIDRLITSDPDMMELKNKVRKLQDKSLSVLIVGESGTGKELIAQALHGQRKGSFIAVNCATLPESLVDATLFGASKGSYTGCTSDRPGYFQQAQNGTLFLDEISELPLHLQTKLLRVLETKEITRVGDTIPTRIECRFVCATNILELRDNREFRQDLYYRVAGSTLRTKPLRERREDIRAISYYMDREQKLPEEVVAHWVLSTKEFPFKGNVRELKNMIEEYIALL